MEDRDKMTLKYIAIAIILIIIGAIIIAGGYPIYSVWEQGMTGKAELARAEQNRQIAILEATAKRDSAVQLAQAEIERSRGVAEANKIIGESLQGNSAYLTYLWIQGMQTNQMQVVYVPTEANLPILEAERFGTIK